MDQDLQNGWKYMTYIGINSRELKSHEHWNDKKGSIYEMPPVWKVFYTNHYKYMSYYMNRGAEVKHSSPSSDYWSLMYTLIDARSPTNNENGNQGTRVQSNKCE